MEPAAQLALAFGAAALAGAAARRLGQSVVPAYVLAGMGLGPLLGLAGDASLFAPLAMLGLALLMFFMGLDTGIGQLTQTPRATARDAALDLGLNFLPAVALGLMLGWPPLLAAFLGLASYATSSGIAVKAIMELRRGANQDTGVVMNLMVAEDIITAVLLAGLAVAAPVRSGGAAFAVGSAFVGLVACAALLLAARHLAPWLGQRDAFRPRARNPELLILGLLALVMAAAAFSETAGLSAALGAFLLGLALADGTWAPRLRETAGPLRDAGGAVFFLAFGMSVDVVHLDGALPVLLLLIPLGLGTKFLTGLILGRLHGQTRRARVNIATTLLPRGEFSIIVAGTAAAAGFGATLGAVTGLYVMVTAVVGSVLMTLSSRLALEMSRRASFWGPAPRYVRLMVEHRAHAMRPWVRPLLRRAPQPLRAAWERDFFG